MLSKLILILLIVFFEVPASAKKISLALNWKPEPEFGGFYAAQIEGFYKKQGFDVNILEGGSGTPTIQMLANNQVDFAIVSAEELIISVDRNPQNPVKAVFAVFQKSPYVIMTHENRKFKSIKDVFTSDGLLSIQAGLPYFQFLVKKFGKPKALVVPFSGGVGAFLQNPQLSQQGFINSEPILADKAGAKVKAFLVSEEGFNPYLVVLAASPRFISQHPQTIEKFTAATREGWVSYLKNPKKTNEHMAKLNKAMDLDTFHKSAEIQKPLIEEVGKNLGVMTEQRWKDLIKQMRDIGLINNEPPPNSLFINP